MTNPKAKATARLGAMMEMRVNPEYHALRHRELGLTAAYLMKVQIEKEEAREERERLREKRKAEQELAAERERLEKQRSHYLSALAALKEGGDPAAASRENLTQYSPPQVDALLERLSEIGAPDEREHAAASRIGRRRTTRSLASWRRPSIQHRSPARGSWSEASRGNNDLRA